jgi:hypothetical protein
MQTIGDPIIAVGATLTVIGVVTEQPAAVV